jgi:signal transduction histidine kinase
VVGADVRIAEFAAGLEELSFSTRLITNSAQAGEYLETHQVDAIVCDFSARAPTGEGLLRFARRVCPDATRILRTGPGNMHIAIDALSDGLIQQFLLVSWPLAYARRILALAIDKPHMRTDADAPEHDGVARRPESGSILLSGATDSIAPMYETLEAAGHLVSAVDSAAKMLAVAAQTPPSVAIVDIDSVADEEMWIIAALKRNNVSLPVLACGRARSSDERVLLYENGIDDYLERPCATSELLYKVNHHERSARLLMDTHEASLRAERLQLLTAEASALLAHDLNNGLFVAMSDVSYIATSLALDSSTKEACESARRSLRRIAGLVDNFVQIARLEDSMLSPKRQATSLPELLTEVISIHEAEARPKNIRWVVDCPGELKAAFDRSLIERALHNIVGNALRYVNPKGSVRLRAFHEVSDDHDDELVLEIGNTGPTIPDHVALTLFEKFAAGTDKHARSGMGMYFCRLACEAHGGSIELHPVPDYAANLTMRIPFVDDGVHAPS